MYSEFLRYSTGDGKDLGIVLTPPYITKLMVELLEINEKSRVMDLAAGSAGFLISSMEHMIKCAETKNSKGSTKSYNAIEKLKREQLLGIEINARMLTLAATNMILRGDGESNIIKGDSFQVENNVFDKFKANRLILNPPFSAKENGMPFFLLGLNKLQQNGLGAIIIQDSAGNGKAEITNPRILEKHTMIASIKMPTDLFEPSASVQTSIYIFKAHVEHDYNKTVKFINFENDGYKRSKRGEKNIDNPDQRYIDIIKIYKAGLKADVDKKLWDLEKIYIEDKISNKGDDWNFNSHFHIDNTPSLDDFKNVVKDYLDWSISNFETKDVKRGRKIKK